MKCLPNLAFDIISMSIEHKRTAWQYWPHLSDNCRAISKTIVLYGPGFEAEIKPKAKGTARRIQVPTPIRPKDNAVIPIISTLGGVLPLDANTDLRVSITIDRSDPA
uniref:Uncharacterized protein n=1 Tax=Glossina pallidipes TaxID=7398 RepID=A0A1B0A6B4_GLOPL